MKAFGARDCLKGGSSRSEAVEIGSRVRSRVAATAVGVMACCLGIALTSTTSARARVASECVAASHGGTLTYGGDVYALPVQAINESQWQASYAYTAFRYQSDGTVTYQQDVPYGYWEYGTAGNANRGTEIWNRISQSNPFWIEQDKIC